MGAKLDSGVGKKRGRPDVNAEPNVIPFIDVMLVLLIIFMVTAPIASVDIKTEMPSLDIAATKRENKPVWVTLIDGADCNGLDGRPAIIGGKPITSCPAVAVMEEQVSWDVLGTKAVEALQKTKPREFDPSPEWLIEQRIYLRASSSTKYKNVMRVMNRLQDSLLIKVALVAKDPTP
jgi:biopolymer transport protein ExbD